MKPLLITLSLLLPLLTFSQKCDCESNFNWVKKTFEENDAGFTFILNAKGETAYQSHNNTFSHRVKETTTDWECTQALNEWLAFFRSGHIALKRISNGQNNSESIDQYKNWKQLDVDIEEFFTHLKTKKTINYEGVWERRSTKIGIKQIKDSYIGFIIETSIDGWEKGQVKLEIHPDNSVTYYMNDRSFRNFKSAELVGGVFLEMGYMSYNRVTPKYEDNPEVTQYINSIKSRKPYFKKIIKPQT